MKEGKFVLVIKREGIVRLCSILFVMGSCVEQYPFDQTQGERYSFSVDGNGKFEAVVRWGIDGIEYNDRINANGYASGFELKENELFYIQVDTTYPVKLTITLNKNNSKREMILNPGELYKLSLP